MPLADPKSVNVNLTTGTGVDIEWKDGHRTHYSFQWLRDACPCALPMYKEPARPREVLSVGRYAVNFVWNDGHNSGIYSWDFLRAYCRCAACQEQPAVKESLHSE